MPNRSNHSKTKFGENMKNVLLFLLSLVLIASVVEAKTVNGNQYQIPKTTVAPVIDGVEDAVWKTLDWNMQRIYNVGDPPAAAGAADSGMGLSGMSKAMWDATNLYVLIYTVDDVVTDIPANANWNQDAIEMYFDADNSKIANSVPPDPGGGLAPGDYQFTIQHALMGSEATSLTAVFGAAFDTVGCAFKIRDVADTEGFPGFMVEIQIPLASLGFDGTATTDQQVGWEIQQDESDDATIGRQAMSKWWSNSNNSWTDASIWGTAVMSQRSVDAVFEISKLPTATAIAIDGQMDAIYKSVNPITMNLFRVGDPPAADVVSTDPLMGSFITAYPAYDADNFYVFMDVVDQVITDIPANANWNQDAIEIYFDADNSKIANSVPPDPGGGLAPGDYQFTIQHALMGSEATSLTAVFGAAFDTVGCEFKIVDRDARDNQNVLPVEGSGYNVELKIPLASLGIDGSALGALLGFEIQQDNSNDATIGRQGMQKWWNASNNSWTDASLWGTAKLGGVLTVGVEAQSGQVARSFELAQNYPNPFNPSTEISFTLAKSEKVKLTVYNLLGKEVAVLVNGTRNAGHQTVTFDAKNLSSGVYFYKLEAGSSVLAKKMMLLK